MKKIGMVIINYNDFTTTKKLLENIGNYNSLAKIVVVDNHSTDDSYQKLKKLETRKIAVIESNRKNGYAAGMNVGASYLIKELGNCHIIFSNSDIIIEQERDLTNLSSCLKENIAAVGPVIYEHGNYNRGWKRTSVATEILLNLPLISRYFKKKRLYYSTDYYQQKTSFVDVLSGCFFMVDSRVLEMISYFDERTFLYYEELIFSKKLQKIGKKLVVNNQVQVIHEHSVTIDKNINRIRKYKVLKTSQQYYVKNYLHANALQLALLWITNKLSLSVLYLCGIFRK